MNKVNLVNWLRSRIVVVSCVAAGVLFAGLALYRYGETTRIDGELVTSSEKLEKMRRNARMAPALTQDAERMKDFRRMVDASLMNKEAKASNLAYFYEVGSRCGVTVTRADQREAVVPTQKDKDKKEKKAPIPEAYGKLVFELGFEGPFASILSYVDTVRAEHPLMRVDSFTIRPSTNPTGRIEEATLSITILTESEGPAK
jgi:hypothetical protein